MSDAKILFMTMKIASILAQGLNHNGPAPVVYVSGEEVCISLTVYSKVILTYLVAI